VSDPGLCLILISSDSFGSLLSARRMSHFGADDKRRQSRGVNAALYWGLRCARGLAIESSATHNGRCANCFSLWPGAAA